MRTDCIPGLIHAEGAAVMQEISATGKLEADTEEKLKSALESYTENFINTRPAK